MIKNFNLTHSILGQTTSYFFLSILGISLLLAGFPTNSSSIDRDDLAQKFDIYQRHIFQSIIIVADEKGRILKAVTMTD
jgi:hypothetical protein